MAVEPVQTPQFQQEPITGRPSARMPPRYFEFASPTDKNARNRDGVSAQTIRDLVKKYGKNILIGFDVGRLDPHILKPGENPLNSLSKTDFLHQQLEAFKVAKELGVRLHAYLGGPCGPTGSRIEESEANFMRNSAQKLGINTNKSGWMNEWNSWGWKETTKGQIKVLKQLGFESYEIDNLYRDAKVNAVQNDDAKKSAALANIVKEAQGWDNSMKLMLKNMDVGDLQAVEKAMQRKEISRARLADFHISEENFKGQWLAIERASARLGIQMARSHDTRAYACSTEYNRELQEPLDQFLGLVADVVSAPIKGVASLFGIEPVKPQPPKAQLNGTTFHVKPSAVKIDNAPPAYTHSQTGYTTPLAVHPVHAREPVATPQWSINTRDANQDTLKQNQDTPKKWHFKINTDEPAPPRQRPA